jgi:hypothetical protein
MPYYDEDQKLKNRKRRESEFEQWRKWFIVLHTDEDVNSDMEDAPRIAENITVEQLRGIFSMGYRFAMLQVKKSIEAEQDHLEYGGKDYDKLKYFFEIRDEMFKFIDDKIEDSFGLNMLDGEDRFTLSKKLKKFHENDVVDRSLLKW